VQGILRLASASADGYFHRGRAERPRAGDAADGSRRCFHGGRCALTASGDGSGTAAGGRSDGEGAGPLYWGFLWGALLLAVVETVVLPDPVVLVTVAAVASFLLAPITFGLNYWCVTRLVDDEELRPGRLLRGWALAGILFMAGATGLYLWLHVTG